MKIPKKLLVDAIVHLINKDYIELAEDYVKLGFLTPETDIHPIVPALETAARERNGRKCGKFQLQNYYRFLLGVDVSISLPSPS